MFTVIRHSLPSRGNNVNLLCLQPRTTLYTFFIHCFSLKSWNAFPDYMKTVTNSNLFKIKLKQYLHKLQSQAVIEK